MICTEGKSSAGRLPALCIIRWKSTKSMKSDMYFRSPKDLARASTQAPDVRGFVKEFGRRILNPLFGGYFVITLELLAINVLQDLIDIF